MDNFASTPSPKPWKKRLFWTLGGAVAGAGLLFLIGFGYVGLVTRQIDQRIEQLHATRSSVFYALYPSIRIGQVFKSNELNEFLQGDGYVEKHGAGEDLREGEYEWTAVNGSPLKHLTLHRHAFGGAGHKLDKIKVRLGFQPVQDRLEVKEILRADTMEALPLLESIPKQIGAFFAGRLRTQNSVPLSEMPVSIRLAIMGIEDVNFLEHHGISFRGIFRALVQDVIAGKFVQGGSTLTQQLMKNLFFTREKAISRKFKEAFFAFVTELRHSKETILEAYLNEVYVGQWGTHEIHGVAEGARYFYNREVSQISLAQSATLAAIVQAPNAIDPRRFPDRAIKRRNLVLKKMLDADFISQAEYQVAIAEPLGVVASDRGLDDVDYFLDLALEKLPPAIKKRLDTDTLTIYVTLNPLLQAQASRALSSNLDKLEKNFKNIQDAKAKNQQLQSALIAIDVKNCSVVSLQGGKSYRQTQFNRILQGKRQPGSLFKPFAYLAALKETNKFTPLTQIEDATFEWKYEGGQTWSPKNYDEKFHGLVTVREALEQSLNIPTAKLAEAVGIGSIVSVLTGAGIKSKLAAVPSISLGSAEVSPYELAEAYTTLANLGKYCELRSFTEVYDGNGNIVLENKEKFEEHLPAGPTFQTVHLLKGVMTHGTAKSSQLSGLPLGNFAGKTGTTSDYKDAWFVGFSPQLLTLVWVGYDEEQAVGLTGSVAALPLWIDFVRHAGPFLAPDDFISPEKLSRTEIDRTTRSVANDRCPDKQVEFFAEGSEPHNVCTVH